MLLTEKTIADIATKEAARGARLDKARFGAEPMTCQGLIVSAVFDRKSRLIGGGIAGLDELKWPPNLGITAEPGPSGSAASAL